MNVKTAICKIADHGNKIRQKKPSRESFTLAVIECQIYEKRGREMLKKPEYGSYDNPSIELVIRRLLLRHALQQFDTVLRFLVTDVVVLLRLAVMAFCRVHSTRFGIVIFAQGNISA